MSILFIILPVALIIAACAVAAFIIATKAGQFDDLDSPPHRALHSDKPQHQPPAKAPPTSAGNE